MTPIDQGLVAAKYHGIRRSPKWPALQRRFLKEHPACIACGKQFPGGKGLQVHHGFPFHFVIAVGRPDLELDERNLMAACMTEKGIVTDDCHLIVCHLGSFATYNPHAREDATGEWHGKTRGEIEETVQYHRRFRPKPLGAMNDVDKAELRKLLDHLFPRT